MSSSSSSDDLISNMPEIVIDKILKQLPVDIAAKTSVLSRTWRRNWLSCSNLVFDRAFLNKFCRVNDTVEWSKGSRIISNVLSLHNGRIQTIHLELPRVDAGLLVDKNENLSRWMSLISRNNCPEKIVLDNWAKEWSDLVFMPSYIFHCTVLVELKLRCFILNPPPFDFNGFPRLKRLELISMKFNRGVDMLWDIVAKCPCLVFLRLESCAGVKNFSINIPVIDAPALEKLVIVGIFDSRCLNKAPRLTDVSLSSTGSKMSDPKTILHSLASLDRLQFLSIGRNLPKFLAAGGMNKSLPVAFNHLKKLCLTDLNLTDSDIFSFTRVMIQSCPFIKDLEISVTTTTNIVEQKYEYSVDDCKLDRLRQVKITGITGTSAELKLTEYVLAIAVMLETLFFKCEKLDAVSELKVIRQLIKLPRASTKAQLVCLE